VQATLSTISARALAADAKKRTPNRKVTVGGTVNLEFIASEFLHEFCIDRVFADEFNVRSQARVP
jgi:hypothetical protein